MAEFTKRMGEIEGIPEMDGTIKRLVELIASPMDTPEQQAQALRESIKLHLHTYMMQKQLLEAMDMLLAERKSIKSKFIDKAIVPFLYFIGAGILWLIANHLIILP